MNEQQKAFLAGLEYPFEVEIKGRDIMVAALRKEIYAAIDREREYQDRKRGDNPHSIDCWIGIVRERIARAIGDMRCGKSKDGRKMLLQATAVLVACLEEHGIVERICDHDWYMYSTMPDEERIVGVDCIKCKRLGVVYHPSTHEYREAGHAAAGNAVKWREPNRVIIQEGGR